MAKKTIYLGNSDNDPADYEQGEKIKFRNITDSEITLSTPKGIKKKGKKDKETTTKIEPDKPSRSFKITGKKQAELTYKWTVPDPETNAMRTGRIRVS